MRRDPIDAEMHARLVNWARVYGGKLGPRLASSAERIESGTLDALDAQTIEQALVAMRVRRPQYYRIVELAYLRGYQVPTCCAALRCSDSDWYARLHRVYSWIHGRLSTPGPGPLGLTTPESFG